MGVYLVQQKTNLFPKALLPPSQAPETSFTLETQKVPVVVGEEIAVKLLVRSDIDEANLFVAKIKFPADIVEVTGIKTDKSFIQNWVEQFYDNKTGEISLIGGFPSPGYRSSIGQESIMAIVTFKARAKGEAKIAFTESSAIYRNTDNLNILNIKRDTSISISTGSTPPVFQTGFNVSGITHYGYSDLFPSSSSLQIDATLAEIQKMNSKTVRVFVANKHISDEEAARRLDDFLTKAAVYNISVIVSFIDFYNSGFSPQGINYTRCDFTPCLLGEDFFVEGYKGRYKQFVQTIIEKNKNHSNIYAWEVGNELKYENNPQVFINFMKDISSFVKTLDPSRSVATGMLNAGHTGLSPEALYSQLPDIDMVTIHQYNSDRSGLADVMWARSNNKKVILEEFGFSGTNDRSASIKKELDFWKGENIAASLQWGFIAKGIADNGNGDRDLGMDNIWHTDYDTLFDLFKSLNAGHIVPTPTPTPTKKGDGNRDGKIDLVDMSVLLTYFNKTGNLPPIDMNNDGVINTFDFSLMRKLLLELGVIKDSQTNYPCPSGSSYVKRVVGGWKETDPSDPEGQCIADEIIRNTF